MASPIDHHPFAPRLGSVVCTFCGQRAEHESHDTEPAKKQATLDRYITDVARAIAPKLRELVGDQQHAAVTIALELARQRVTVTATDPPYGVSAEEFQRALRVLESDTADTLAAAMSKGLLPHSSSPIQWRSATISYARPCRCGHSKHDGECPTCDCPEYIARRTGELARFPLRVTRERQVVCARCERLYNPDRGECICAKPHPMCICQRGARTTCPIHGAELASHLEETEKRHRGMASPEAEAAARRDHGDGDGRIPGRPECPSNECQIRQTCTGHAGCTAQYPSARISPPHPTTPCIGCNPQRPCFNGWKACEREGEPIGSLMSFEVTSVPVARRAVFGQIAEERIQQDTKWGGPSHDDTHNQSEWLGFISEHLNRAKRQVGPRTDPDVYRHELIAIAALCVAAIETHDRAAKAPKEKP